MFFFILIIWLVSLMIQMKAAFGGGQVQVFILSYKCIVTIGIIMHYSFAIEYLHYLRNSDQ